MCRCLSRVGSCRDANRDSRQLAPRLRGQRLLDFIGNPTTRLFIPLDLLISWFPVSVYVLSTSSVCVYRGKRAWRLRRAVYAFRMRVSTVRVGRSFGADFQKFNPSCREVLWKSHAFEYPRAKPKRVGGALSLA